MELALTVALLLAHVVYAVTSNDMRTFNVTSLDGTVTQLQYPWQQYSECLYRGTADVLYCMDDYPYIDVQPVWKKQSEIIKYVKVNCLWNNPNRSGMCYCKDRSSVATDGSKDEKFFRCQLDKLDTMLFNFTSSLEVLDVSDNNIRTMDRQTFNGLDNLRYCSLDRNMLDDLPDKLFCSTPNIEFVSLNGLALEHFPSHSFRCNPTLTKLTVLEARDSQMKDVPADLLEYIPALESLDLGGNKLPSIYKATFAGASRLRHLNLSGNSIRDLFPQFCSIMQSLTHLHLRANNMTSLNLDEIVDCISLEDLDLSQNSITVLTGNASSLTSLQRLNISRNSISNLISVFPINGNLSVLDISQNRLINLSDSQFKGLGRLKLLNLSQNILKDSANFETLFNSMTALELLDLSNNKLSSLPNNSFYAMTSLKSLLLSDNLIVEISEDAFKGLGSLERLLLDGNKLSVLSADTLKPPTSLNYLSLSRNSLTSLGNQPWPPSLNKLFIDHNKLTTTPSTILFSDLDTLDLSNNQLTSFIGNNENLLVNLAKMKYLDISHNIIDDMSPQVLHTMRSIESLSLHHNMLQLNMSQPLFKETVNLTYLNLAENKIRDVQNMFEQNSLKNLITLNISGNPLRVTESIFPTNNSHLKTLDMSNCNIQSLKPNVFLKFEALTSVYLKGNDMKTFPAFGTKARAVFYLMGNPLVCACNMSWLLEDVIESEGIPTSISNYKLPKCSVYGENGLFNPRILQRSQYMCLEVDTCDSKCVCYKTNDTGPVITTVCQSNLKTVPSAILGTSLAIYLDNNDFSSNSSLLPLGRYRKMSAKELYMNSSAIAFLDNQTFHAFDALEILYLSDNVLEFLPTGIFSDKRSLKQLYLNKNILSYFENDVFKDLPNLDKVDISGNTLVVLSTNTLSDMSLLSVRYFSLAHNPWACNCSNREFKVFVDKIEPRIFDRRELLCDETNVEILQLSISSFTCPVKARGVGSGKPAMIIGIIVASVVVFVLLAVFVYYRRELFALLYVKTGCRIPGKKHVSGMHFDAYISYDPNDQHCSFYVLNTLVPRLKNNGFNYQTSTDIIEDSEVVQKVIEDSRASIFIVNKNFTSNPFQIKVFQSALYVHKRNKSHNVVIIIHGDIDLTVLEPDVMKRLRNGDYITSRSRLWWERLIYELPTPSGHTNPNENDDVSESDVIVFSSLNRDNYDEV